MGLGSVGYILWSGFDLRLTSIIATAAAGVTKSTQSCPIDRLVLVDFREIQGHCFGVLLRGPGVENHYLFVGAHAAIVHQLLQHVETHGGFGANRNPLLAGDALHPIDDAVFPPGHGPATAGADGVEYHEVADCRRHAQAAGYRLRIDERLGESFALFERTHNRRAAVALTAHQLWQFR